MVPHFHSLNTQKFRIRTKPNRTMLSPRSNLLGKTLVQTYSMSWDLTSGCHFPLFMITQCSCVCRSPILIGLITRNISMIRCNSRENSLISKKFSHTTYSLLGVWYAARSWVLRCRQHPTATSVEEFYKYVWDSKWIADWYKVLVDCTRLYCWIWL